MNDLYFDKLSGEEFESYLYNLFLNLGYEVEQTQSSNDYGADLIINKDDEKIVVQAKRYQSSIGISAIQEVIGSKNYYKANKCMVVTNNYFTPNAIELAKCNNVELWNRDILIYMAILSVNPKFNIKKENQYTEQENNPIEPYEDELLEEAINLIMHEGMASISLLQRYLRITFSRASRLIDEIERRGIIGPFNGSNPREILKKQDNIVDINFKYKDRSLKKGLFSSLFKK